MDADRERELMNDKKRACVAIWSRRGIEIDPDTIEEAGFYEVTLLLGDVEPRLVARRFEAGLKALSFRRFDVRRAGDTLGVLPQILARPGVVGGAFRHAEEIVVVYAMRGGLPIGDVLPCRARLILRTTELLGPWQARGLEALGVVSSATDEQLVLSPSSTSAAFESAVSALLASGATVVETEQQRAAAYTKHVTELVRRAGGRRADALRLIESAPPARELGLLDRDGASLLVVTSRDGLRIERTSR